MLKHIVRQLSATGLILLLLISIWVSLPSEAQAVSINSFWRNRSIVLADVGTMTEKTKVVAKEVTKATEAEAAKTKELAKAEAKKAKKLAKAQAKEAKKLAKAEAKKAKKLAKAQAKETKKLAKAAAEKAKLAESSKVKNEFES